jgi:hypothetical protein
MMERVRTYVAASWQAFGVKEGRGNDLLSTCVVPGIGSCLKTQEIGMGAVKVFLLCAGKAMHGFCCGRKGGKRVSFRLWKTYARPCARGRFRASLRLHTARTP